MKDLKSEGILGNFQLMFQENQLNLYKVRSYAGLPRIIHLVHVNRSAKIIKIYFNKCIIH